MSNYQLSIADEVLDMGEEQIAITRQVQKINAIDSKLGSYSRSFTVPVTQRNKRILDYSTSFSSNTVTPYRRLQAKLYVNSLELASGTIVVENDGLSEKEIRLTFYADNSPFFQTINTLKMWDLPLGKFDHFWSYDSIYESNIEWSTRYWVYPIIDYGDDSAKMPSESYITISPPVNDQRSFITMDRMFPSIFVKHIVECITAKTGYKFVGNLLDPNYEIDTVLSSDAYTKLILPFSLSKWERCTNYSKRYGCDFTLTGTVQNISNALIRQPVETFTFTNPQPGYFPNFKATGVRDDGGFPYAGFSNAFSRYTTHHWTADNVKLRVKCKLTLTTSGVSSWKPFFYSGNTIPINTAGYLPSTFISGKSTNTSTNNVVTYTTSTLALPSGGSYELEFEMLIDVEAHSQWKLGFEYVSGASLSVSKVETRVDYESLLSDDNDDKEIKLTYPDSVRLWNATTQYVKGQAVKLPNSTMYVALEDNQNVPPAANPVEWANVFSLPDQGEDYRIARYSKCHVSGYTLVENTNVGEWLKQFMVLFGCFIFVNEDTREVRLFQISELYKNIGKAVDWTSKLVNRKEAKWSTRPSGYGQVNTLQYTNESELPAEYASHEISIDDTTLPLNATVIKSIFSAGRMERRFTNLTFGLGLPYYYPILVIKRLDEEGKYSGSGKQRIAYFRNVDYIGSGNIGMGNLRYQALDGEVIHSVRSTDQPHAYFYMTDAKISAQLPRLDLQWEKLYYFHYRYLSYMLDKYKEIEVEMLLDAVDFYSIDFTIPVYIDTYDSFFFIQSIKDWTPNKPTTIELVRL